MQNNPRPLDETRAEITAIDQQIQQLFLRRMACAEQVPQPTSSKPVMPS